MTDDKFNKLVEQVESLTAIDDLRVINEVCVDRLRDLHVEDRDAKAKAVRGKLRKGTKVVTAGNLRPKYLLDLQGTVQSAPEGDRVAVKLDYTPPRARRYAGGTGVLKVPLSCVEILNGKVTA